MRKVLGAACLLGLAMLLALGAGLVFINFRAEGDRLSSPGGLGASPFYRRLREYDGLLVSGRGSEAPAPERLNRLLDDLEKEAMGVETYLSVLKRRRALAAAPFAGGRPGPEGEPYRAAYRDAAERAARVFPYSEPLAAVAAEALVRASLGRDGAASSGTASRAAAFSGTASSTTASTGTASTAAAILVGEAVEKARDYAALLQAPGFSPLALGIYVLSGDLGRIERAAAIPRGAELLGSVTEFSRIREWKAFLLDAAILNLLRGAASEAMIQLQPLLANENPREPSDRAAYKALLFGAELFYDFGDPRRAAEIFSRLPGDPHLGRQGDALWLAGGAEAARVLWAAAAAPDREGLPADQEALTRSLYNLGATARNPAEELAFMERLLALNPEHVAAVIRYTRLQNGPRAIAVLEGSRLLDTEPLIGLERLRRHREDWSIDRMIPETWLLLNRHPQAAPLYRWGCYYFDLQRRYDETARLIRSAEQQGVTGPWLLLHRGLALIREGRLDAGEETLRNISGAASSTTAVATAGAELWQVNANLARVLEAKRSPTSALEFYEIAASQVEDNRDAALLQLRIARCLRTLGRDQESRRVLEYALGLDDENLNIRLELQRLGDLR
jgi:tetratricopeptide (TPR) repeat protein